MWNLYSLKNSNIEFYNKYLQSVPYKQTFEFDMRFHSYFFLFFLFLVIGILMMYITQSVVDAIMFNRKNSDGYVNKDRSDLNFFNKFLLNVSRLYKHIKCTIYMFYL